MPHLDNAWFSMGGTYVGFAYAPPPSHFGRFRTSFHSVCSYSMFMACGGRKESTVRFWNTLSVNTQTRDGFLQPSPVPCSYAIYLDASFRSLSDELAQHAIRMHYLILRYDFRSGST